MNIDFDAFYGHWFARDFRPWALDPPARTQVLGSRFVGVHNAFGLRTPYSAPQRDKPRFRQFCHYLIDARPDTFHCLRLDILHAVLGFLPTKAEHVFYNEIETRGLIMNGTIPNTLPKDVVTKLEMSLASLEQALLTKDEAMARHLKESHQLLLSYPEAVHLLTDAEIARLISGAKVHTHIEIVKAAAPKRASKKMSAEDL